MVLFLILTVIVLTVAFGELLTRRGRILKVDGASLELRHAIRYDPILRPFQFLIRPYRRTYFYFDTFDMLRRIFLVSILPVLRMGSSSKAAFGVVISLLWLMMISNLKPYAKDTNNALSEALTYLVFYIYFLALVIDLGIYSERCKRGQYTHFVYRSVYSHARSITNPSFKLSPARALSPNPLTLSL